jgi:hypothetical protein
MTVYDECGVLYVASGASYVKEAIASATSVKKLHPSLRICLISDQSVNVKSVDLYLKMDAPEHGFIDKIAALKQTPFTRTLFLDSDTVALSSLDGVFALLDRFDIAVAHEPARFLYPIGGVPDEFPELNTGVLLYTRSAQMDAFVDDWLDRYRDENSKKLAVGLPLWHDQISFTKALWASDLKVWILPPEWNYRAPFPQFLCGAVRIFHGRLKNSNSDLTFVNKDCNGRIMNPNPRRIWSMLCNTFRIFQTIRRQ